MSLSDKACSTGPSNHRTRRTLASEARAAFTARPIVSCGAIQKSRSPQPTSTSSARAKTLAAGQRPAGTSAMGTAMPVCQWWVTTKIDAPGPSAARTGAAAASSRTTKIAAGPARDSMGHMVREHSQHSHPPAGLVPATPLRLRGRPASARSFSQHESGTPATSLFSRSLWGTVSPRAAPALRQACANWPCVEPSPRSRVGFPYVPAALRLHHSSAAEDVMELQMLWTEWGAEDVWAPNAADGVWWVRVIWALMVLGVLLLK